MCYFLTHGDQMRVLMVTPGYHPIKGGTETIVRNLSLELNKAGVHTDVMTFNMDRKWNPKWKHKIDEIDGFRVFRIPALNWLPMEHSPRITLEVNLIPGRFTNILKQYDMIHFHEAELSFPLFSLLVRRPKIFHLHGIAYDFYKRYHLSRIIFKHVADLYISITRQMEKNLEDLGIPKAKIEYLPNAVDTKLFCPQGKKENDLLLFVGRIQFDKGLHVLLESLHHLKNSVRLAVIGPMDESSEYCRGLLKNIERENRIGAHEILYLGALDSEDIIRWYQKASIFILPSFKEALPLVALEALSCETPVIATPVGGIPEIIQNFESGLLVPPNNPQELAKKVQFLLDNKYERIRLGRKGRKSVIKNFSLDEVLVKLCNIYSQLSARR